MAGQSYALVVYSLNSDRTGPWRGGARITRYMLTQFQGNSTTVTPGYVNPGDENNFQNWPQDAQGRNLQTARGGRPTVTQGTLNVLVDFVDGRQAFNTPVRCPGDNPANPIKPYSISPPDSMLTTSGLPRSFYACVSAPDTDGTGTGLRNLQAVGNYQDVVLYLRGSAVGRPGVNPNLNIRSAELLPTLETRVMLQSVLSRNPNP